MNEQEDGSWMVTSLILDHVGHPVTKADFYSHQVARQLEPNDKAFVKELINARANAKNIANVLTERNGVNYSSQDVRNIVARIKTTEGQTHRHTEVHHLKSVWREKLQLH